MPDRPSVRPGRVGELRLLRGACPLVLGLKSYLLITAEGMPVAWCLADAKLGVRNVVTERLARAGRAAKA